MSHGADQSENIRFVSIYVDRTDVLLFERLEFSFDRVGNSSERHHRDNMTRLIDPDFM